MQVDIRIVRQLVQLSLDEQAFLKRRRLLNHALREVRRKRLALVEALAIQDEQRKSPRRTSEGRKHRERVSLQSLAEMNAAVKNLSKAWTAWMKEGGDAR
jgi:flagellar biosynthesis/type III secretory pathway chaperone